MVEDIYARVMEVWGGGSSGIHDRDELKKVKKKECEDVFHPIPEINEIQIINNPPYCTERGYYDVVGKVEKHEGVGVRNKTNWDNCG